MNNKRNAAGPNPWIKPSPDEGAEQAATESQLPPSPWSQEVPPPPTPPWEASGVPSPVGTPTAADGTRTGGDPVRETSAAWGETVSPPSLRRPAPAPKRRKVPPLLLPIGAAIAMVALLAIGFSQLTGRDDDTPDQPPVVVPTPAPSTHTPPSTYTPPTNALAVGYGVSVVPRQGWSVLAKETQGRQLVTYGPNGDPRAFFWVRQREKVSAKEYLLRIVEGETAGETTQLGNERNLPCPRDVLVECRAIDYVSVTKGVKVQGFVETYRRKDGVVTGIDFRTRADSAPRAVADAQVMKKSVIDSL